MKKISLVALALIICASAVFMGGCRGGSTATAAKEITLVSNKIEIDSALKDYAAVYEQQTGVKVNVKSYGGESPYAPALSAMFNSGNEPEIFVIEGNSGYSDAKRAGRILNLSSEPWVRDTDVAYLDPADGSVIGFPVAIEGWGLGYNVALLSKAGIDPKTLTNVGAIKAAFEKIDGMKSQLGITSVVSMVAGPGMTWVTGLHGVNAYLALGLPYANSTRYIDMLLRGEVDTARLTKFGEYFDLLFKYSDQNTLITGGYDQQVGNFAAQRAVFVHQGNWIDPDLKNFGTTFEMGYIPHAFLDTTTDGIFVGPPSWYLINAKSPNIEEAKKFLIALASTREGHDYMVNKAGMVPAFKSVTLKPSGPLSMAVQEWVASGKIYAWHQNEMPDGFGMDQLGPIFSQLAAKQINVPTFVRLFTAEVAKIK